MIGPDTFCRCSSVENIIIPDSVTSICNHAFYECTSITSISIPHSVTSIDDYAFYGTSLINLSIPASVASIGEGAFNGCKSLVNVTIGNNDSAEKRSTEIGMLVQVQKEMVAEDRFKSLIVYYDVDPM